jgi:DNA polymerase III sliding clamp (beta) subunit (PCNA family)
MARITVKATDLRKAITAARRTSDDKSHLKPLGWVYLEVHAGGLDINSTDLESFTRVTVPGVVAGDADCSTPLGACVNAKHLAQTVKGAKGDIDLTFQGIYLRVESGGVNSSIPRESMEEWPNSPEGSEVEREVGADCGCEVSTSLLADALRVTLPAASHDETRYNLNGVHFRRIGGGAQPEYTRVESTDGYRMHWYDIPVELPEGIVPWTAADALLKAIGAKKPACERVKVERFGDKLRVEAGSLILWIRLVAGEFPNTGQIIDREKGRPMVVEFDAACLEGVCDAVINGHTDNRSAADRKAKPRGKVMQFQVGGELKPDSAGIVAPIANVETELACKYDTTLDGKVLKWGFNASYLRDAIRAVGGDRVSMRIGEPPNNPIEIHSDDSMEGPQAIVMPLACG